MLPLAEETYNNALQGFAAMVDKWQEDINNYAQRIHEARAAGKPVAGMEINLNHQQQRLNNSLQLVQAAYGYIKALAEALEEKNYASPGGPEQYAVGGHRRQRICDMPPGPWQMHNELLQALADQGEAQLEALNLLRGEILKAIKTNKADGF